MSTAALAGRGGLDYDLIYSQLDIRWGEGEEKHLLLALYRDRDLLSLDSLSSGSVCSSPVVLRPHLTLNFRANKLSYMHLPIAD